MTASDVCGATSGLYVCNLPAGHDPERHHGVHGLGWLEWRGDYRPAEADPYERDRWLTRRKVMP